jgi:hypothetical protein
MRRIVLTVISVFLFLHAGFSQLKEGPDTRILFHGLIMDAETLVPISNAQIFINREFAFIGGEDGSFTVNVHSRDSVLFRRLGYKPETMFISDTLKGREFIAGIYMNSDTLKIGEVVILPRYRNLRSEILNSNNTTPEIVENAQYNVAVTAYQAKAGQNELGNAQNNYALLNQRQKTAAFEKGTIASEHIAGLDAFMLIPAGIMILRGLPDNHPEFKQQLTNKEVELIQNRYLELKRQKK